MKDRNRNSLKRQLWGLLFLAAFIAAAYAGTVKFTAVAEDPLGKETLAPRRKAPFVTPRSADAANFLYVDDDYDASTPGWGITRFDSIQDALDMHALMTGDTLISVFAGTYTETIAYTRAGAYIVGEDRSLVTIDGGAAPMTDVVLFSQGYSSLEDVTVRNGDKTPANAMSGIRIVSFGNLVNNCLVEDCRYGIVIYDKSTNIIDNTRVHLNDADGIYVRAQTVDVANIEITNGEITNNGGDGIRLVGNTVFSILTAVIKANTIAANARGISSLDRVNGLSTEGNTISSNTQGGVVLTSDADDGVITQNIFQQNAQYGLSISGCTGNTVHMNDFLSNQFSGYDDSTANNWFDPILLRGNYWDDHPGGLSDNGIYQTPYALDGSGNADLYPLTNSFSDWRYWVVPPETETEQGLYTLDMPSATISSPEVQESAISKYTDGLYYINVDPVILLYIMEAPIGGVQSHWADSATNLEGSINNLDEADGVYMSKGIGDSGIEYYLETPIPQGTPCYLDADISVHPWYQPQNSWDGKANIKVELTDNPRGTPRNVAGSVTEAYTTVMQLENYELTPSSSYEGLYLHVYITIVDWGTINYFNYPMLYIDKLVLYRYWEEPQIVPAPTENLYKLQDEMESGWQFSGGDDSMTISSAPDRDVDLWYDYYRRDYRIKNPATGGYGSWKIIETYTNTGKHNDGYLRTQYERNVDTWTGLREYCAQEALMPIYCGFPPVICGYELVCIDWDWAETQEREIDDYQERTYLGWEYPYLDYEYVQDSEISVRKSDSSGDAQLSIWACNAFDEYFIDWNNQPALGSQRPDFTGYITQGTWYDINLGAPSRYYAMREANHYKSDFYSSSSGSPPTITHHLKKGGNTAGLAYMQTNETSGELLELESPIYSPITLSEDDIFQIDLTTTSENQINLKLLNGGSEVATLEVVPDLNSDHTRHIKEITVTGALVGVSFDQMVFSGTLEDPEYFTVHDIKVKTPRYIQNAYVEDLRYIVKGTEYTDSFQLTAVPDNGDWDFAFSTALLTNREDWEDVIIPTQAITLTFDINKGTQALVWINYNLYKEEIDPIDINLATPAGTDVLVEQDDFSLLYDQVTGAGTSTVDSFYDPFVEDPFDGYLPHGFYLASRYYQIDTTATWSGQVLVGVPYDVNALDDPADEDTIHIWHFDEATNEWVMVTDGWYVDKVNKIVYGYVDAFSPFALLAIDPNPPPIPEPEEIEAEFEVAAEYENRATGQFSGSRTDGDPGWWYVYLINEEKVVGIPSISVYIDGDLAGTALGQYAVPSEPGWHTVYVEATDDEMTKTRTSVIYIEDDDTDEPQISLDYIGSGLDEDPGYFEWEIFDASGLSDITIGVHYESWEGLPDEDWTLDPDPIGTWNLPPNIGEYTITVEATDADEDWIGDSLTAVVMSTDIVEDDDTDYPEITISYTGGNTDGDPGYFEWAASDDSGIGTIEVSIVYNNTPEPPTTFIIDDPGETGTWNLPPDLGTYTMMVSATDADNDRPNDALTSVEVSDMVLIVDDDTEPPTVAVSYNGGNTDGDPGAFSWACADASGIETVSITIEYTSTDGSPDETFVVENPPDSGSWNLPPNLGTYEITVSATDADNDRTSDSLTVVLTTSEDLADDDTDTPVVSELIIEHDNYGVYIEINATDSSGIGIIEVYVNGELNEPVSVEIDGDSYYITLANKIEWIFLGEPSQVTVRVWDADTDREDDSLYSEAYGEFELTLQEMYAYVDWRIEELKTYIDESVDGCLSWLIKWRLKAPLTAAQYKLDKALEMIENNKTTCALFYDTFAEIFVQITEFRAEIWGYIGKLEEETETHIVNEIHGIRNDIVILTGLTVGSELSYAIAALEVDLLNLRDYVIDEIESKCGCFRWGYIWGCGHLSGLINGAAWKLKCAIFYLSLDIDPQGRLDCAQCYLDTAEVKVTCLLDRGKITQEEADYILSEIARIDAEIEALSP